MNIFLIRVHFQLFLKFSMKEKFTLSSTPMLNKLNKLHKIETLKTENFTTVLLFE